MNSFLTVLIVLVISVAEFFLIKLVCKPIKTMTAILLLVPTAATCGIALLIYKFFRTSMELSISPKVSSSSNSSNYTPNLSFGTLNTDVSKKNKKKVSRSFTDSFGKTLYYDEEDNIMGGSMDNGYGKTIFTDASGNYAGEGFDNGMGHTTYTDKDGNITTSNTNYAGDENFSDGTTARKDSFGNKYYS